MKAKYLFAAVWFAIVFAAIISQGGERHASTPLIDPALTGIEQRLIGHDAQFAELEKQIEVLQTAIRCPCGRGGKCICDPETCVCPNCPEHKAKQQTKASGVRVLFFTADWCGPCRQEKARLGSLMDQIEIVDCTNSNPKPEYGVTAYPTFIKLVDGKEVDRKVGAGGSVVANWLSESRSTQESSLPPDAQPTPWTEIGKGLNILKPKSSEVLVEFGCGYDARFLTSAARFYGTQKLIGVEIDVDRADSARRHVLAAELDDRITILDGDATKTEVDADVGMAYLWPETLAELRPKIEQLDRFVSYAHAVPGLRMTKHGSWYLYSKPKPMTRTVIQRQPTYAARPQAVWGGQAYSGPVCNSSSCSMCASIRSQLGWR